MNISNQIPLLCCFILLHIASSALSPIPPPITTAPQCHPDDRNTLLRIKQVLNNTDALSSWIPDTDCCNNNWEFVACDESTGRVTSLYLDGKEWSSQNDIPRVLPTEVGDLTYLESLAFFNLVIGPIPQALVKLQRLDSLYLSHNRFSGHVPSFFSQMQSLSWIDLSGNQLTGLVPSFLGQMQALNSLDLSKNKLSGSIPSSFANAPNLYSLRLNNNKLTGRIPQGLGHVNNPRGRVIHLFLNNNKLSGPIPRSFGDVNFRSLFLSDNKLIGDATFLFGKEKPLGLIELSRNKLSFNLSRVEFSTHLSWIGLNHNKIYGSLPQELTQNRLEHLDVSYNRLCGPIPVGGWLQTFNETAYFHNKCLCGLPLAPCA